MEANLIADFGLRTADSETSTKHGSRGTLAPLPGWGRFRPSPKAMADKSGGFTAPSGS